MNATEWNFAYSWPYTACDMQQCFTKLWWEVFDHPPAAQIWYQTTFIFSSTWKYFLSGKQFRDNNKVRFIIAQWLQSQAALFFEKDIQTLVPL